MTTGRELLRFEVEEKKVIYYDKIWKWGIQIYPLDRKTIDRLKSGSKNMQMMAALILDSNKGKDLEDYESCKNEDDLAKLIRKDCKSKGLIEVKSH